MNSYFYLLLICSAMALYGQNPAEKSTFEKKLEKNLMLAMERKISNYELEEANARYRMLNPAEQKFCDLSGRELAIMHARVLVRQGELDLIPGSIDPKADVDLINNAFARAKEEVSEDRLEGLSAFAWERLRWMWKRQADAVGKKCTWPLHPEDDFD